MYRAEERAGGTIFATRNSVKTPKLIAHRGAHVYAPQNSLPAFSIAGEYGVWAIETDVHQTSDGVLVCCHNATTGECYGEDLVIAQTPYAELRKLRMIKGNNLAAFPEDELRMPLFEEYLQICRRAGAVPFLELKADIAGEVIRAVRRAGMEDHTVVSAICFEHLAHAREFSAKVFLHHIFSGEAYFDALADMGYAGLSLNYKELQTVPAGTVEAVHERGLRICFRAADTPDEVRRAIALGTDYVPSNRVYALPEQIR